MAASASGVTWRFGGCTASRDKLTVEAMERRSFLRMMGAASIAPGIADASPRPPAATVLFDDRATPLTTIRRDPKNAVSLWISKRDLPRVNGFEVKPQGACRADLCVPIPKTMQRGDWFDLTAFARKAGE